MTLKYDGKNKYQNVSIVCTANSTRVRSDKQFTFIYKLTIGGLTVELNAEDAIKAGRDLLSKVAESQAEDYEEKIMANLSKSGVQYK